MPNLIETVITDLRYGFISGALKETLKVNRVEKLKNTKIIDNYLTNKYLGIPIFIFFMWLTFFTTFKLGGYPKYWMEAGFCKAFGAYFKQYSARYCQGFSS